MSDQHSMVAGQVTLWSDKVQAVVKIFIPVAVLQPLGNSLDAQARYCSSFQLTHMSREDHARSIESAMASKSKTSLLYC